MKVRIDEEAMAEARALALDYLRRNPTAARKFLESLDGAFCDIAAHPSAFPFLESLRRNKRFRRLVLKEFPVVVIYEIIAQEVLIVAVAHGARRTGYWRGRL